MTFDPTLSQGLPERRRSQEMSLQRRQPPAQVPGYDLEYFLGDGAYGEVWVAVERNTGRRVAIKFYAHRSGLDWSLLSREVEKLAFLFADRYVVQLISVGWDAEPPYYIMEFLEQGSLAERLQSGPLSAREATELFRDVAIGLVHAHNSGVLHCDLKPANILLDQDGKPRLADFGQSRLSHEQVPALGTLFYMAPEQADLKAVPDARWDVYALGAVMYCMLTGDPPYRTEQTVRRLERFADLDHRLAAYRRLIGRSAAPTGHRTVRGVDRALAEIIDRCLAAEPAERYPNVQAVLDALDSRAARRAFRPMTVLGAIGPVLLLLVVSVFAWQGFTTAVRRSEEALSRRALDDNRMTASYVAGVASKEILRRFDAVEQVGHSPALVELVKKLDQPDLRALREKLVVPRSGQATGDSPSTSPEDEPPRGELAALRKTFREHPERQRLEQQFKDLIPHWMHAPSVERAEEGGEVASWFFCDANGISTFRLPRPTTVGIDYSWRSFFHGGDRDLPNGPPSPQRLDRTRLSAVFESQASHRWIVAIATPVRDGERFLGVLALTVRVDQFVELKETENLFAVLVDLRPGDHTGMILQHPLLNRLRPQSPERPGDVPPGSAPAPDGTGRSSKPTCCDSRDTG